MKIRCAAMLLAAMGSVASAVAEELTIANAEIIEIPYVPRLNIKNNLGEHPQDGFVSQSAGFSSLEEKVINGVTEFVYSATQNRVLIKHLKEILWIR